MTSYSVGNLPLTLFVGYERENDARGVAFDYSFWAEEYGQGVLQMLLQRPGDANPYPVLLSAGEDGAAVWLPNATDTAKKGKGEIQLIYTVNSVVVKTAVLSVLIDRSLGAGGDPPDPFETWLEDLTELAAETQQAAESAAESASDAETAKDGAENARDDAVGYADAAGSSALTAEGWAVGEQGGTEVPPGSPYYNNNAKFYAAAAQQGAAEGGWVRFYIDADGHLHYVKTPNVDLIFYLADGHLHVTA